MNEAQHTAEALAREIASGTRAAEAMVLECSQRIAAQDAYFGAFIHVCADAVAKARKLDRRIAAADVPGPLTGVPVAVKDLLITTEYPTTFGGKHRLPTTGARDARVVTKLLDAGAIVMGKTNLHEYAFGTTGVNPHYGPARNPTDPERIAGGSSGGNSVALMTGMCLAAVGTDTGGSIRIPAALTGHVGLKPTYGLISTAGVLPLAPSLDHVGPMTTSVTDAALMLSVLAGRGAANPAMASPGLLGQDPFRKRPLKIGVPRNFFFDVGDDEVLSIVDAALARVRAEQTRQGWTFEQVTIPMMDIVPEAQRILLFSEAFDVHRERWQEQPGQFGPDVLARLDEARDIRAGDYIRARRQQTEFRAEMATLLRQVDLLVTPTVPIAAPKIGENTLLLQGAYHAVPGLLNRCTHPWNFSGLPAITVPCGRTRAGLPVGMQLVAARMGDVRLLSAAKVLEGLLAALPSAPKNE